MERVDITGKRFGSLTAIRHAGQSPSGAANWLFRCDCGNEVVMLRKSAEKRVGRNGGKCDCEVKTNEAALAQKRELVGQKWQRLTLIELIEGKVKHGQKRRGRFQCDCGNVIEAEVRSVVSGNTGSCGCKTVRGEFFARVDNRATRVSRVVSAYKAAAKRRGYAWELSDERAYELLTGNCFYCEAPPAISDAGTTTIPINGIDRIDNTLGYIEGNVVSCCDKCNWVKNNRSVLDIAEKIDKVMGE